MKNHAKAVVMVMLLSALSACGMSTEERARQDNARRDAMQKALADSIAEEREKDRRMREAASTQADERMARDAAQGDVDAATRSADATAQSTRDQQQSAAADAIRRYIDKIKQTTPDPATLQLRNVTFSPNGNGMCAEYNAVDKTGSLAGFKRVVVTDTRVAPEEPPTRETLTQFLLFQLAARDTGCFPDVHKVRMLQ